LLLGTGELEINLCHTTGREQWPSGEYAPVIHSAGTVELETILCCTTWTEQWPSEAAGKLY
jgi:hypothetical protein